MNSHYNNAVIEIDGLIHKVEDEDKDRLIITKRNKIMEDKACQVILASCEASVQTPVSHYTQTEMYPDQDLDDYWGKKVVLIPRVYKTYQEQVLEKDKAATVIQRYWRRIRNKRNNTINAFTLVQENENMGQRMTEKGNKIREQEMDKLDCPTRFVSLLIKTTRSLKHGNKHNLLLLSFQG